jgi:hypothetical protein
VPSDERQPQLTAANPLARPDTNSGPATGVGVELTALYGFVQVLGGELFE